MVTSCELSPGNIGPNFLAQDSKHWHRGHVASVPWEMGDIFPLDGLSEALWAARGPRRISSPLMGRGREESLLALTGSPAAPCGSSAQGAPLSVHCTLPEGERGPALPSPGSPDGAGAASSLFCVAKGQYYCVKIPLGLDCDPRRP